MKQAVLGYEQKFFINGTQLSGVQSVNGSYAISEKPINIIGWGHVNSNFYDQPFYLDSDGFTAPESLNVLNAPLEGSFSINSALVSEDFFLNHTGDNPFTGSIHHGNQYFGFYNGYITSHSVSCSVGQIPSTSTSISVFGDIGGSPDYFRVQDQDDDSFILQQDGFKIATEDSVAEQNYNASGVGSFPEIRIPNQGSIIVECAGAQTDRVTSFTHNIQTPINPIYTVGSSVAAQVDVQWPISTTTSFTLDIDKYNYSRLRAYLRSPNVQDISIKINDCLGVTIQNYIVKKARLLKENMSASSNGRMTVNLEYISYYNKR
ncbi:MAG: hypothetical protein F3745_02230 [Nitrospinae bacterium]|nr:hypothetical protein [Nitrospinota bacterium]